MGRAARPGAGRAAALRQLRARLALDGELGAEVLRLIEDRQGRIDFERTYWRERRITDYPLLYADQDVLNAILGSRVDADRLVATRRAARAAAPVHRPAGADERTLRCAYDDGTEPYLVHHWLAKPWLEPTHHGVYSQLLRRLLVGDDVAIKVPERRDPAAISQRDAGFAERKRINARERFRYHVREPLAARRGSARR